MFLLESLQIMWGWLLPFLLVLTVLVFIHELGHYLVARWNGVRVEVFSIGFGPALLSRMDRHGTIWKFSLIPLGGYVKMYGDANEASTPDAQAFLSMTDEERALTLEGKSPLQRIFVSIAGPVANILLTFLLFSLVYMFHGKPSSLPIVGALKDGSVAAESGIQIGDRIQEINGHTLPNFTALQSFVMSHPDTQMKVAVDRDGMLNTYSFISGSHVISSRKKIGTIGVKPALIRYSPVLALREAVLSIVDMTQKLLKLLKTIVVSGKGAQSLGSVLSIAKMSKDSFLEGIFPLLSFMAILSLNLGVINLLPIPMLDGGHIVFYLYEYIFGKPIPEKMLSWLYKIGFALLISVMLFTMWNDLMRFKIISAIVQFFK